MFEEEENPIFLVLFNHEEQYSIWMKEKEIPIGWRVEGKEGSKQDCLEHIGNIWTDMRPLSLRKTAGTPLINQDID